MEDISLVKIDTITPDDGYDYFFAYYDLQPYDKESEIHLTHRVKFHDRIPTAEDICEVGYITICDKVFHKVAKTRAWNFQQGAQLQWFDDESIFYNDFRDGEFCGVIKNVCTGAEREICKPLANLSADRRWGLSINFPRVWDFRAGYGYCNYKDRFFDEKAPAEDGIFLVDIENNTAKLIIDYATLREAFPQKPHCDHKLVVNHITFNPSSSRFLFLLRDFPEENSTWGTILITANPDFYGDYRCDLHDRFNRDGTLVSFDSLGEGNRRMCQFRFDKKEILAKALIEK